MTSDYHSITSSLYRYVHREHMQPPSLPLPAAVRRVMRGESFIERCVARHLISDSTMGNWEELEGNNLIGPYDGVDFPDLWIRDGSRMTQGSIVVVDGEMIPHGTLVQSANVTNLSTLRIMKMLYETQRSYSIHLSEMRAESRSLYQSALILVRVCPEELRRATLRHLARIHVLLESEVWWAPIRCNTELTRIIQRIADTTLSLTSTDDSD